VRIIRPVLVFLALLLATLPVQAQGTWQAGNLPRADISGGQFHYNYLLPPSYSATGAKSPLYIHEHEDSEGTKHYNGQDTSEYLPNDSQANTWYNNSTWLNAYKAIVVLPYADQTCGDSTRCNFGGYADSPGSSPNETAVAALAKYFVANFNVDPNRIYITGNSLGGIGSEALMLDYNQLNGTVDKIFTAGLSLAGRIIRSPSPSGDANTIARMKPVPLFAVSGASDGTSPPEDFNRPFWRALAGNSNYPGDPGAAADGSAYRYLEDPGLGHDVWDTYRPLPRGKPQYDWLFAQVGNAVAPPSGPQLLPAGFLHTSGNQVLDQNNNIVRMACMGTYFTPADADWAKMAAAGVNCIRVSWVNSNMGNDLVRMDRDVSFAKASGIKLIFDNHTNELGGGGNQGGAQQANGLWYDSGGASGNLDGPGGTTGTVTQQTALNNWVTVAQHFAGNDTVIGFDLWNEPLRYNSNMSTWEAGSNNPDHNIRWMYENVGKAIQAVNPGALIIAEGPIGGYGSSTTLWSGGSLPSNMVAGDLSLAQSLPVVLTIPNKVVYSVHDYPNSVGGAISDAPLKTRAWGYLETNNFAPVWIGEMGGSLDGANGDLAGDQAWANVLIPYMNGKDQNAGSPHFTGAQQGVGMDWWCWGQGHTDNPDCVLDDSNNFRPGQKAYWSQLLFIGSAAPAGEALTMNTNATVRINTAFTVSGSIANVAAAPTLQYQDNGGTWQALPAGATVTATAWSFSHPGVATSTFAESIAVRDANNTSISVTGPAFIIAPLESANNTVVTTVGPTITDAPGNTFSITSGAQILINGVVDPPTAQVTTLAYENHVLWQLNTSGDWYSFNSFSNYGGPTKTSPIPTAPETLAFNAIGSQTAGVAFTVTGVIGNMTAAPTLQYQDNGGAWQPLPGGGGLTRNDYDIPGGAGSAWVTAFGAGATWSAPADADTIDIARGWNGSNYTAGPYGNINTVDNFGATYYVGKASDPQYTFTDSINGRTKGLESTGPMTTTMHVPNGARTPGPFPGDNALVLFDPVNHPHRMYGIGVAGAGGIPPPGLNGTQGPFSTGDLGEWDDTTSDQFGEDADSGLSGINNGAGLINACDVTPACNSVYPHIQHAFRYETDAHLLRENGVTQGAQQVKANSWPLRLQDGQSGINLYVGNLLAGATLGIPSTTAMPSGLDSNCQGMFWSMQHYASYFRDMGGGGFNYTVDQVADTSPFIASVRGCLPRLVALLRVLRNQHQTGQDFVAFPKNGPGVRTDTGPPPLAGTGGTGGTSVVTATTFSFIHPAMAAAASNTIAIRDANATGIVGTSGAFAVTGTQGTEALTMSTVADQVAGSAFTVTGTISGVTSVPSLQYQDGTGAWAGLPAGAVVSTTSYTFSHPAMTATSSAQITVRDAANQSVVVASNRFVVTATTAEKLTINTLTSHPANTSFPISGSISGIPGGTGTTLLGMYIGDAADPASDAAAADFFNAVAPLKVSDMVGYIDNGQALSSWRTGSAQWVFGGMAQKAWSQHLIPQIGLPMTLGGHDAGSDFADITNGAWDQAITDVFDVAKANGFTFMWLRPGWEMNGNWEPWSVTDANKGAWNTAFCRVSNIAHNYPGMTIKMVWNPAAGGNYGGTPADFNTFYPGDACVDVISIDVYGYEAGHASDQAPLDAGSPSNFTILGGMKMAVQHNKSFAYPEIGAGSDNTTFPNNVATAVASSPYKPPVAFVDIWDCVCAGYSSLKWTDTPNSVTAWKNMYNTIVANSPGAGTPPTLQYQDNSGPWAALPSGSTVSTTGFSFTHPGMAAAPSNTTSVRDAGNTAVAVTSNPYAVGLAESPNNRVVNTVGPTIVDSVGESFAITAGAQITVDGIVDPVTAQVTTLAYVNHVVYQLNTSGDWYSKATASAAWFYYGKVSPLPAESLAVNPIGQQAANVAFTVSGTISAALTVPTLQYQVGSSGSWLALPSGSAVSTSAFSFVVPGIPTAGATTISVRDAGTTTIVATSNSFSVVAAPAETLAVNTIANQVLNRAFTVSGTIANATAVPTLQYQVNAGSWLSMPAGATVTQTTFSFTEPGIATSGAFTISVRDANATTIVAASNSFTIPAAAIETLAINTIGTQTQAAPFTVSGTIGNQTIAPTLEYAVSGGAWLALPGGATVTATGFSFTEPGIAAAGSATISVRDAGTTTISATSNSFNVGTVVGEALAVGTIPNQANGRAFTVTGTITNAPGVPSLQYQVNATGWLAMPAGATVTQSTFSFTVPGITVAGTTTVSVRDSVTPTITATSNSFTVAPGVAESLVINLIANQAFSAPFTVSGGIAGLSAPPTLQYRVNSGTWLAMPAGANVTATSYAFSVPGIAVAGSTTISVRDANVPTITVTSNSFQINAPAAEALTMQPIGTQPVGIAFTVSGGVANVLSPPTLQYQDNGGSWLALPVGGAVSTTGYSFLHPGLPASPSMVVAVRDVANTAITVRSQPFSIVARESPNLTTVTTVGPQIVDSTGTSYTLTVGKQVAVNGVPDPTTSGVIEIAYVNRSVWYETGNLLWWQRQTASTWTPPGGTPLGPVPSSTVGIFLTSSQPLAVVPGFTIQVPGIQVNDTVSGGTFTLQINAQGGVVAMPGAAGSGTTAMSLSGPMATLNSSLSGLLFTGRTVGLGGVNLTVTDPAHVKASNHVNIAVVRAPAVIPPGRTSTHY
jgi:endoglucanase